MGGGGGHDVHVHMRAGPGVQRARPDGLLDVEAAPGVDHRCPSGVEGLHRRAEAFALDFDDERLLRKTESACISAGARMSLPELL